MRRETDKREPTEAVLRWWEPYGAFGARFAREWHREMPTLRRHPTLVTTAWFTSILGTFAAGWRISGGYLGERAEPVSIWHAIGLGLVAAGGLPAVVYLLPYVLPSRVHVSSKGIRLVGDGKTYPLASTWLEHDVRGVPKLVIRRPPRGELIVGISSRIDLRELQRRLTASREDAEADLTV